MSKFKRKDWSLSKFQVIVEKVLEFDLMVKKKKVLEFCQCFFCSQVYFRFFYSREFLDRSLVVVFLECSSLWWCRILDGVEKSTYREFEFLY